MRKYALQTSDTVWDVDINTEVKGSEEFTVCRSGPSHSPSSQEGPGPTWASHTCRWNRVAAVK